MKKSQGKLKLIIEYFNSGEQSMLYLPPEDSGVEGGETNVKDDEILMLGNGHMLWITEDIKNAPESPYMSVDELMQNSDTQDLLFDLFNAEEEEKLDSKKLYSFEDKLRRALKASQLDEEKIREVRIAFMDAKEAFLDKSK